MMSSTISKIAVTGASGFVGLALCRSLLDRGLAVVATGRQMPATPLFSDPEFIQCPVGDIGPSTDWANTFAGVDVLIHLAARVHVMNDTDINSAADFRRVNAQGSEHLARVAAASGVKRFVYISSIKVNGVETRDGKKFSGADAAAPQEPYGISKWEAEQGLQRIAAETGMELVIVRPPLVYGSGVKGNFAQMMGVMSRGIPLPLAGIDNRRSLIYVENLISALIACATHPAAAGRTYLVSDGEDISTPDILRQLAGAMGEPVRLFYCPPALLRLAAKLAGKSQQMERLLGSLQVDSDKMRTDLNWVPPFSLRQGLQATAEWYQQNYK